MYMHVPGWGCNAHGRKRTSLLALWLSVAIQVHLTQGTMSASREPEARVYIFHCRLRLESGGISTSNSKHMLEASRTMEYPKTHGRTRHCGVIARARLCQQNDIYVMQKNLLGSPVNLRPRGSEGGVTEIGDISAILVAVVFISRHDMHCTEGKMMKAWAEGQEAR